MTGTTSRGYPYPQSGDNFIPSSDFQALAGAVDTDVAGIVAALGTWTTYTPAMYKTISGSKAAIAATINFARYIKYGKLCTVHVDLTAGAASTGGVGVQLPFAAASVALGCGSGGVFGGSPPANQSGVVRVSNDQSSLAEVGFSTGYIDIASGQLFVATATYETA